MKLEALKNQGARSDLTSAQLGRKLETADIVGQESGDSRNQVRRFIRLTNLVPELLDMVDEKKIAFNPAVELSYRGFELNIRFDSFKNEHQAVLRAELSYPVSLGDDARGNITRLDNAIDNFADRIADAENALQNLEQQKQAAEFEVAKSFAQEEELQEKSARLAELNALLNIDRDRSSSQDAPEETEEAETPAARPSVLAALEEKANQPEPVKPFRSYYDKDGDAR